MLRAVVLLAFVAAACAVSPFASNANPNVVFATAARTQFVPVNNNVLLLPFNPKGGVAAGFYRVISSNAGADPNPAAPIRTYFGDPGRERFQNDQGFGIQPQSHLFLSQANPAQVELVDPRFVAMTQTVQVNRATVVPMFQRVFTNSDINVGDIVYIAPTTTVPSFMLNGVTYYTANKRDILGTYTAGISMGLDFPSHISSVPGNVNAF